ncbi:hypothetical protein DPX16_22593 [Anabarilius grahami]|uniref:Uncharacterized protein n=1 Tax=Anabarilius grahami TaxID=495550 RepID=A0A3N0XGW9_ANAGA|nr:hypothetical protein DPX16_22593 [Anabarilius grahami]
MNVDGGLFDKQQVNDSDSDDGIVDGWMNIDGVDTGWRKSQRIRDGNRKDLKSCKSYIRLSEPSLGLQEIRR